MFRAFRGTIKEAALRNWVRTKRGPHLTGEAYMALRFNPPPNWPPPPAGWAPSPGWQPDPAWGPPPPGWALWIDDGPARAAVPNRTLLLTGAALAALVVFIAGVGIGAAGDSNSPTQANAALAAPTTTVTTTTEATVTAKPRVTVTATATKTVKRRVVKTVTAEPQALLGGGGSDGSGGSGGGGACAPGYDPCIPPYPPDVNCPDVDGPIYVTGSDPHGLDADGDGVACES